MPPSRPRPGRNDVRQVGKAPHAHLVLRDPDGGANLHVRLRALANLSTLAHQDFWAQMQANKWVYRSSCMCDGPSDVHDGTDATVSGD